MDEVRSRIGKYFTGQNLALGVMFIVHSSVELHSKSGVISGADFCAKIKYAYYYARHRNKNDRNKIKIKDPYYCARDRKNDAEI